LTREHIPPRSAFNGCDALWDRLVIPKGASDSAKKILIRGGFTSQTLCAPCNNNRCGAYAKEAKEYVKFVRHLVESPRLFDATGHARYVRVPCDTLLLAKQIAVMILAVEPSAYAEHCQSLRHFVMQPDVTLEPNFKVLAFLVPDSPAAGTITRFHARVDTFVPGYQFIGGEISWFPFGLVYTASIGCGYDLDRMTDITHWFTNADPRDRVNEVVRLHCRLTGVESIQCGVGRKRTRPQMDYLRPGR
jgi:hypothetical protein